MRLEGYIFFNNAFFDHYDRIAGIQPHSGGRYGSPGWSEAEPGVEECKEITVRGSILKREEMIVSDGGT